MVNGRIVYKAVLRSSRMTVPEYSIQASLQAQYISSLLRVVAPGRPGRRPQVPQHLISHPDLALPHVFAAEVSGRILLHSLADRERTRCDERTDARENRNPMVHGRRRNRPAAASTRKRTPRA